MAGLPSLSDSAWRGQLRDIVIIFYGILSLTIKNQLVIKIFTSLECASGLYRSSPVLSHAHAYAEFWKMQMIRVVDMLKIMDEWAGSGVRTPFSIIFVTNNMKLNTGGKKISLEQAILVGTGKSNSTKRNPDHYGNYTRNIRAVDSDRLIKIHVLLITRFNGMRIIL